MNIKLRLLVFALLLPALLPAQKKYQWKQVSSGGYAYRTVTGDPMAARFYKLKNGLTVILTVNKKEPRIQTLIGTRAGSNTDPADHTGLAHYLEHMLFKGTDKFGSLNWAKEKPYLDMIDQLYEDYNQTSDVNARKAIYRKIDSVSGLAATFAIANEYDKIMKAMGAQGSNAHTSVEETVYEEDVPANALDKYLTVQAERFRNPIFRIFHTELEAVYEEKNRGVDEDGRKVNEVMLSSIFPTHNYGQQTTIGTIEHLKSPSLKAIRDYYYSYYVPNNMAIVMSGDFDPDYVIKLIDTKFSYMKAKPVKEYNPAPEAPITSVITRDVFGPSAESMRICYRSPAWNSRDAMMLDLIASIFSNGKAGLLDLNLNKQQKVLGAAAGMNQNKDYGVFILLASPKQNQSLEEVKDLLIAEIAKLKKGDFDESLIKAIVSNRKLQELRALDGNGVRANTIMDAFIQSKGEGWPLVSSWLEEQAKFTKKEIVDFANRYFRDDNYVVINKRKGEDKSIVKVEKPPITPVEVNKDAQSPFATQINTMPATRMKPLWLDYNKDMSKGKVDKADLLYVQNKTNDIFSLYYRFDMGSYNSKLLPIAAQYLQFLGTDKMSSEQISKEFYNIACNFNVNAGGEITTVAISGLRENFSKAVTLFEQLLTRCKADETALNALKDRIIKTRSNAKTNKGAIMNALTSYAYYGAQNPNNNVFTTDEIKALKSEDLINALHELMQYKHTIMYYGPMPFTEATTTIRQLHKMPADFIPYPAAKQFNVLEQQSNQVLFAHYDMVQAEIRWMRNTGGPYDPSTNGLLSVYNNYFGGGIGSIVFQTIRESKALAYSTFAQYRTPDRADRPYSMIAYVGSQADKFNDAVIAMNELLNDLPQSEKAFTAAIDNVRKDLETSRITEESILFNYLNEQRLGLNADSRINTYNTLGNINFAAIKKFHQEKMSNKPYTYCIVASDKKVKEEDMAKYGTVKKLTLEELFGY
jgi:predicted Zn-dependent peptidase